MRKALHPPAQLQAPSPALQRLWVAGQAGQRPPVEPHPGATTNLHPGPAARPAQSAAKDASAHSCITTGTEVATASATRSASQLVMRTQPCDSVLPTWPGSGVPCRP
ncbi:hypothetical protein G6F50_017971 [Rhizopus delemar]|uniref:Uncharacterized protein n=1 Tax=Rhizopus delemar TaxID=936053 RepID=A0A9P6XNS9_9FUNG|nr:hypothetical protein G6F50_017971 [Rhizopus delemar]